MRDLINTGFILDGGMGTQLIDRGLKVGETSALWNLERPHDIVAVHEAYAIAGAEVITANTFSANRSMLSKHGLESKLATINRAAVALAKPLRLPILGDIGPCGDFLEPMGDLTPDELTAMVHEQGEILARAGVDGFLIETVSDPNEMAVTIQALKGFGLPILASFTYESRVGQYQTMMGTTPAQAVAVCAEADVVGANCGTSLRLADYLELADLLLAAAGDKPVILQPNAGTPIQTSSGLSYEVTPEQYADFAVAAREKGVRILGGCCGTTPAHIQAVRARSDKAGPHHNLTT